MKIRGQKIGKILPIQEPYRAFDCFQAEQDELSTFLQWMDNHFDDLF